jgi:hypothetical protein
MKNLDYNIEGADCGRFPVRQDKEIERRAADRKPPLPTLTAINVMGWHLILLVSISQKSLFYCKFTNWMLKGRLVSIVNNVFSWF